MSSRFTALILGLILVAGCLPLVSQTYTLQQLTIPYAPNTSTWTYGINNRGAIVGTYANPNGKRYIKRGFKRDADGVFEPPIDRHIPNCSPIHLFTATILRGINDDGVVVGNYRNPWCTAGWVGFVEHKGTFIDYLPKNYGAREDEIHGINNKGNFVGTIQLGTLHQNRGFAMINNVLYRVHCPMLGIIKSNAIIPEGIAADGTIVGTCIKDGVPMGYIRGPAGEKQLLQVPGADATHFSAINNVAHKIVGYYTSQGKTHGLIYDYLSDTVTTVDWTDPNTQESYVTGINSHGVIVGYAVVHNTNGKRLPVLSFIGTPQ